MSFCMHLPSVTCDNCRTAIERSGRAIYPAIVAPVFVPQDAAFAETDLDKLAREVVSTPIRCQSAGCRGIWWQGQRERSRLCSHLAAEFAKAASEFIANGPGGP